MDQITIGQICAGLALVVGLVTGIRYMKKAIREWITSLLKEQFEALNKKLSSVQERIDEVDMGTCKNFLVARLAEVEKGHPLDEIERERFWEQYEHYQKIGGNTYIQRKVEQLKAEGKI